ncbi:MAG: toxin-antitoxin system YwqK family antitoxin [Bacteroidales bacterium]
MLKSAFIVILFLMNIILSVAQNVGQPGNDSIINYTDIQGNKQGKWIKKYDKDKIAYIAYFKDNKLVGNYKRWYYSGALKAEINYNADGSVGYAKFYWDNGKLMATGKYINQNVKDSIWQYYATDGVLMLKESYKNGVLDGNTIAYFRNGNRSKLAPYTNGKLNGIYKEYWEDNGNTRLEIYYKDGVRYGPINVFYEDGKPYLKGNYFSDLPHGKWIVYFRDGTIEKELDYYHGNLKDEEKYNKEFKEQMKKWEQMKGKIPEPTEEDFFNPKQKSQQFNNEY